MGYFILLWGRKAVAYVDEKHVVIEPVTATHVERCLAVYGLRVNMGVDEDISAGGRRLSGYRIDVLKPDATEGYIVKAIEVCLGLLGAKAEREPVGKIYELTTKKDITELKVDEHERGEKHEEQIGFEPV